MEFRQLFILDKKDYSEDASVVRRPSARAVVVKDDKVLLIHSEKFDYYKFPGGGIEPGESPVDALIREVKEETGFTVIKESIEPWGRVLIRHKDDYRENSVFEQENLYFFCRINDEQSELNLDDYEKDEGFNAQWKEPFDTSWHNKSCKAPADCEEMINREAKVLDLLDLEIRKRKRELVERNLLESLEQPDAKGKGSYIEMLSFVEDVLNASTEDMTAKEDIAYSRFEHTKRVLGWMLRLYKESDNKEKLRFTDLVIATIFHDVGRPLADQKKMSHALAGGPITREYLEKLGYDRERVDFIVNLVEKHSDKWLMKNDDIDPNLLLLMEADLLDDMGAQGIVMDCMITEKRNPEAKFTDCLDHMTRYTRALQKKNPMVSFAGRKIWEEKTDLVNKFVDAFETDCTLS